jgi:hypothetical protein
MNALTCMVADCSDAPTTAIPVSSGGIVLDFGVCAEHAHDIDGGVLSPTPTTNMRGLIGISETPPDALTS